MLLEVILLSTAASISATASRRQSRCELKAGPFGSIDKLDFYGVGFLIQFGVYDKFYVLLD